MCAVAEFDLSLPLWSLLMLTEAYKGNELHTLLVDNVNAKNMNNADMQPSYKHEISMTKKQNKLFFLLHLC